MQTVTINFTASGQMLTGASLPISIASNTVEYVKAKFALGSDWTGFDSVRAIWYNDYAQIATVLDGNGECTVPWEVLAKTDDVRVNLVGSDVESDALVDRLTSYPVMALEVDATARIDGTETAPVTPSQFEQYIAIVEQLVGSVKDIDHTTLNADYTLTIYYTDGTSDTVGPIRGAQGETGNGILSAVLNPDYTLTLNYTNGQHDTVGPIRGATGETGNGIQSIYLTGTSGAVKTYTILFTDGTTFEYQVTDGEVTLAEFEQAFPTDTASGAIASFPDGTNLFPAKSLVAEINPIQDLHGYDSPWVGGAGVNKYDKSIPLLDGYVDSSGVMHSPSSQGEKTTVSGLIKAGTYTISKKSSTRFRVGLFSSVPQISDSSIQYWTANPQTATSLTITTPSDGYLAIFIWNGNNYESGTVQEVVDTLQIEQGSTATAYSPYENICPISGHDEVDVMHTGKNLVNLADIEIGKAWNSNTNSARATMFFPIQPNTTYTVTISGGTFDAIYWGELVNKGNIVNNRIYTPQSFPYTVTTKETSRVGLIQFNKANVSSSDFVNVNVQLELGSTATTYEPYQGQSYHQDIEATYTPTVEENQAYLFKQTGDVGGDRETIELVGGTVAWNQLVNNGDFAENSGWSMPAGGTISNEQLVTSEAGATNKYINTNLTNAYWKTATAGHKYLFMAYVKSDNRIGFYPTGTAAQGQVYYSDAGVYSSGKILSYIWNPSDECRIQMQFRCYTGSRITTDLSLTLKNVVGFDLTAMFGSTIADYIYSLETANAGAGVAWFRKLFPKPYYAYNAGELMSVQASSHDMVGFNAWDEEWEQGGINQTTGANTSNSNAIRSKNYIRVVPNATYYVKAPIAVCGYWYDADKNYINTESLGVNTTFTVPSGACYLRFIVGNSTTPITTYGNNICINLSWDGERDGEYEEYVKHSYPLDSSLTLRGIPKLDASNNLYYDGDEYESDGTVNRRYGVVDLGTLTWGYSTPDERFYTINIPVNAPTNVAIKGNIICPKYVTVPYGEVDGSHSNDKVIGCIKSGNNYYVAVKDTAYTDAATFKTAMSGAMLVYELATPTTEQAEPFESIQKVTPNYGTEEFVTTTNVPVGNNTQYLTRDVYGGYIDFVNGLLVLEQKRMNLGSVVWSKFTNATKTYFKTTNEVSDMKKSTGNNIIQPIICSRYMAESWTHTLDAVGYNGCVCEGYKNKSYIAIYDEAYANLEATDFKSAMDGVQLVYPLAEPMIFQLTPTQVQTLLGTNNIFADTGDVTVEYVADIQRYIDKKLAEL